MGICFSLIGTLQKSSNRSGKPRSVSYTYGDLSNCWRRFDTQRSCRQPKRPTNDIQPGLCDPFTVIALGVGRIQEMAEAVLGPAIFRVIHTFAEQDWAIAPIL